MQKSAITRPIWAWHSLRGAIWGKTGKTQVLPWFWKIEGDPCCPNGYWQFFTVKWPHFSKNQKQKPPLQFWAGKLNFHNFLLDVQNYVYFDKYSTYLLQPLIHSAIYRLLINEFGADRVVALHRGHGVNPILQFPANSPDLTPCDFFINPYIKSMYFI